MSRRKIPEEKKRVKVGGTIDPYLYKILDLYLSNNDKNKSKYLEELIKKDLIEMGLL